MNIADLADQVAAANDLTKAQARAIVGSVFDAITAAAIKGDEVSLPGFGKFKSPTDPPARAAIPRRARPFKSPRRKGSVSPPPRR